MRWQWTSADARLSQPSGPSLRDSNQRGMWSKRGLLAHICNVGGGYPDSGLSDQALVWMIARIQALTGLEFNVQSVKSNTKPNVGGIVIDSKDWLLDHYCPHYRAVLSPVAIYHGYFFNSKDRDQEHINECVHWSVMAKRAGWTTSAYHPRNLPAHVPVERVAAITEEEQRLLGCTE
jgi:hypothetical protein